MTRQAGDTRQEAVHEAARWLAETRWEDRPHPIVPAVCDRFGLTMIEACHAFREAQLIRARAT